MPPSIDALTVAQRRELSRPIDRTPDTDPVLAYLNSLTSEESKRGMGSSLRSAVRTVLDIDPECTDEADAIVHGFPWERLTPAHAAAIRAKLVGSGLSAAAVNKMLAAVRGVMASAWRLELIDTDRRERVKDSLRSVRSRTDEPEGRYIEYAERRALFRACGRDNTARGARDAAVLALLCIGLRRSEVCALDLGDFDPCSGKLSVRNSKGGCTRHIYIDNGARDAVTHWLAVRGDRPGPLMLPVSRSGTKLVFARRPRGGDAKRPTRLDPNSIYMALSRIAEAAEVESITPHDLRRTVISDMLDDGTDLPTVQNHVGHQSPTTTARYDRRGDRAKRRAAASIRVPFVGGLKPSK